MMHGTNVLNKEWGEYVQGIVLFSTIVLYNYDTYVAYTTRFTLLPERYVAGASLLAPPPMLS